MTQIGSLLKKYRLDQGKTQAKFVGHIISRSFYSKIEKICIKYQLMIL